MNKTREKQLVEDIRTDGERTEKAFKIIYKEYFPVIRKLILQKGGNETEAKDVFQDSIIALYQLIKKDQFRADASLKTVLYAISRNLWHDNIRKMKKTEDLTAYSETKGEDAVVFDFDGFSKQQVIRKLIDNLSTDCRRIILYFYYEKWSMEMIREEMKLSSVKVAKNKKYRCMKHLIQLFNDNDIDHSTFGES